MKGVVKNSGTNENDIKNDMATRQNFQLIVIAFSLLSSSILSFGGNAMDY